MNQLVDVTGQHAAQLPPSAFHFHADSGLGTALLANLGFTTATTLAFADSAMKFIINGLMTVTATLIIGYINRRMARRDLAALIAQEERMRKEAARTAAATATEVLVRAGSVRPPAMGAPPVPPTGPIE